MNRQIGGAEYDDEGFRHMRRLYEDYRTTGDRAFLREAATMHEFYVQFPGVRMRTAITNDWQPVDQRVLDELHAAADDRHTQKRAFASSRYWHQDSHFVGLTGEWLISAFTGRPFDITLRIEGDAGADFPLTDVKTSTFVSDPHLKQPTRPKRWVPNYVLCVFDPGSECVRLAGWATQDMLRDASVRDYGHGPNFHLPEAALLSGLPECLFA